MKNVSLVLHGTKEMPDHVAKAGGRRLYNDETPPAKQVSSVLSASATANTSMHASTVNELAAYCSVLILDLGLVDS